MKDQPVQLKHADLTHLKVAIVHDWLIGGGAEKVVLELHKMFPNAPIYTSFATDEWREKLDGKVVTGWLQHFGKLRKFMVLPRIWWFTSLKFDEYDLVISSTGNGEAFGIKTPSSTVHISYCNTPTHYYWRHYEQYLKRPGFGILDPLARLGLRVLVGPLRKWDYKAAQRADYVIANSTHIQADIKKYYGRDSEVIFPPVDTERFSKAKADKRSGFITVGRLAPMKRVDLLVDSATQLDVPLTVIGRGPEYTRLLRRAGSSVTFLTDVSDAEIPAKLSAASAFLFASYEDFGIAPIEAMACGTPIIAYKAGGALDYVVPGKTGEFFDEQSVESIKTAIQNFNTSKYSSDDIKASVDKFSVHEFHKNLLSVIQKVI